MDEPVPMSAKQISRAANRSHPNRRAQEVEQNELPPRHAQRARQQRREHAHAENESRQKNRSRPVAIEKPLASRDILRANAKNILVAFDQRTPAVPPQSKTQLSAQGSRHSRDHNHPGEL